MRKALLMGASLLAALAVLGPATASAQSQGPDVAVCLGAGQSDGSFTPQELNTGQLPVVGLGLGQTACAVVSPGRSATWLQGFAEQLQNAEPPSEPPSQEDIQAIAEAIQDLDPQNPLALLFLADTICQRSGAAGYCNAVIGGALGAPIPFGNVALEGGDSGSCFSGRQAGTGTMFGPSGFYNLEWEADYSSTGNMLGVVSGTARDFSGEEREVTGIYGPNCGAGVKALVLVID